MRRDLPVNQIRGRLGSGDTHEGRTIVQRGRPKDASTLERIQTAYSGLNSTIFTTNGPVPFQESKYWSGKLELELMKNVLGTRLTRTTCRTS
jgi:hypothetical protein